MTPPLPPQALARSTPTIAACMIVRNGAQTIERCIASVRPHVDEVCIYLGGVSTDATVEILARLADEPGAPIIVQQGEWNDDYAEARNRSFAMASSDYVAWIDDDETLHGGEHLRGLLTGDELLVVGPSSGWNPRVARADAGASWRGVIHERLELPEGATATVVDPALLYVTHDSVTAEGRHDHLPLGRRENAAGDTFQGFIAGRSLLAIGHAAEAARLFRRHALWLRERAGRDDDRAYCITLGFLVTAYLNLGAHGSAQAAWRERLQMLRTWRHAALAGETSGPAATEMRIEFYLLAEVSGSPIELADLLADRGLRLCRGRVQEDPRLDDLAVVAAVCRTARAPKAAERNKPCPCGSGLKFKKCCALPVDLDELRRTYGIATRP